ncbi:hypothetical protein E4634_03495 [Mangrovimicrobium sediminis]|uniref:Uncharacterized protein n=1 Tax=Mangrovimicrobium sediminis TaxID=2562682 RepID=A0A4Z0M6S3_9GAMM|nr:hypothetical protein [Haliea sp. SAOS-164]TGD75087.1 hypothetical protein E4634_03495 [Haliea sp. SAOS-164]
MRPLLTLSLRYFACVFAAGFALGTIRVLFLLEALGERRAELLETPFMLAVIVWSAHHLVAPRARQLSALQAWLLGTLALAWLLTVEFGVVLGLRGLSLEEYYAERDPIAGSVYLASLFLYLAMPYIIRKVALRHDQ